MKDGRLNEEDEIRIRQKVIEDFQHANKKMKEQHSTRRLIRDMRELEKLEENVSPLYNPHIDAELALLLEKDDSWLVENANDLLPVLAVRHLYYLTLFNRVLAAQSKLRSTSSVDEYSSMPSFLFLQDDAGTKLKQPEKDSEQDAAQKQLNAGCIQFQ